MAQALREAYPDLFVINENLSKNDREAVVGRFKSLHDVSDTVAEAQARTFFSLLDLADLKSGPPAHDLGAKIAAEPPATQPNDDTHAKGAALLSMPLAYRFEIQLPATKDVEVFRAIFKAMREELINA